METENEYKLMHVLKIQSNSWNLIIPMDCTLLFNDNNIAADELMKIQLPSYTICVNIQTKIIVMITLTDEQQQ